MGYSKSFYNEHSALVDSTMDYIGVFAGQYDIWASDDQGEIRWLKLLCDGKRLRKMLQIYLYPSTGAEDVLENMDHGQMIASLLFANGQQIWDMTTRILRYNE